MSRARGLLLVLLLFSGCSRAGGPILSPVRFAPGPLAVCVEPAYDVVTPPPERKNRPRYSFIDAAASHADRVLGVERVGPALDIDPLGRVPTSSWFVARAAVSPEALFDGPGGSPPRLPLTVLGTKGAGASLGFHVRDARGIRYLIKLDASHAPEVQTGGHLVVHRILWALGYRVAEDHLVRFRREDLRLAADADIDRGLLSDPLDETRLADLLSRAAAAASPESGDAPFYRALASRFVEGKPLGGFPQTGTRLEDPNDLIPHERRRSLRGLFLSAAWLDHSDMKEGNMLDVWVRTEARPGRHHVRHLLIDFGLALGGFGRVEHIDSAGYQYLFEPVPFLTNLFSFGLVTRPMDRRSVPILRGVGWFDAATFVPASWRPIAPYAPFRVRDPNDDLWAAGRIARLGLAHLRAAVAAGEFSDPRTEAYLVETLRVRQEKVIDWAFSRRAPLFDFELEKGQLCFTSSEDIFPSSASLEAGSGWRAKLHAEEDEERRLLGFVFKPGRTCLLIPPTRGYAIVRIAAPRGRITEVHLGDAAEGRRLLGLVRGQEGRMATAHP